MRSSDANFAWTRFDPHGLKFDEATFDKEKDRMKEWKDTDDKAKERFKKEFKGSDDHESDYNSRVNNFNSELDKLRETPFGSAQYEYLKNHEDTFTLQFGEGSDGAGSTRSFVRDGARDTNASYTIAGMDSFGTISHEFQHLVQAANPAYGHISRPSYQITQTGPFKFLADSNDSNGQIPVEGGRTRPAFKEFQAQRAMNIAENEFKALHAEPGLVPEGRIIQHPDGSIGPEEIQNPWYSPSVDFLQSRGETSYNNGARGGSFEFRNPSGSYQYRSLMDRLRNKGRY